MAAADRRAERAASLVLVMGWCFQPGIAPLTPPAHRDDADPQAGLDGLEARLRTMAAGVDELLGEMQSTRARVVLASARMHRAHAQMKRLAAAISQPRAARPSSPAWVRPRTYAGECSDPEPHASEQRWKPKARCLKRNVTDPVEYQERAERVRRYATRVVSRSNLTELAYIVSRNRHAMARYPKSGRLSGAICRDLLADPSHHFHDMWGDPRRKGPPLCVPESAELLHAWLRDMLGGTMCDRNWYVGVPGCTSQEVMPVQGLARTRSDAALGFDDELIRECNAQAGCVGSHDVPGPQACMYAGVNLLALFSNDPSYNMCRNLEWVVCAAQGRLPNQGGPRMYFVPAPGDLQLRVLHVDADADRYSMRSIYFLEACVLSHICRNGERLFTLRARERFECEFDPAALHDVVQRGIFARYGPMPRGQSWRMPWLHAPSPSERRGRASHPRNRKPAAASSAESSSDLTTASSMRDTRATLMGRPE